MATSTAIAGIESIVAQLAEQADEGARQALLSDPSLQSREAVEKLCDQVASILYADLAQAERLLQSALWLAEALGDESACAHSERARGHVSFVHGKYADAVAQYSAAEAIFARTGNQVEVGRTLSSSLQPLIYLGRYEEAFAAADRAEKIFEGLGERLRLARLHVNLGNILYRLDRMEEALATYQRAQRGLEENGGDPEAIGAVLHNLAVCHTSLNRFPDALEAYRRARAHYQHYNLPTLVVQADYNIAYLYYLRGEYTQAIESYQVARVQSEKLGDRYQRALCDLDQSEIYLELNLVEEGRQLAEQAYAGFEALGTGYEAGKALANYAIAASRQGNAFRALELFRMAREIFSREHNHVWPSLIDLYRALVFFQEGRFCEAQRSCDAAFGFFSRSSLTSKAALCELLSAQIHLKTDDLETARKLTCSALERLKHAEAPALICQVWFVLGQVEEARGDTPAAIEAYRNAHAQLENLRSHLRREEFKIAFVQDKLAVYESLVWMCLEHEPSSEKQERAFAYIEQAKSRSLADLIAFRAHALPSPSKVHSDLVEKVHSLREELNWYYRQVDLAAIRTEPGTPEQLDRLRRTTRECEEELVKALGDVGNTQSEFAALQNGGTVDLASIRSALPPDTMLLEYYQARGTLYACLVSRDGLQIVPLTPVSRVRNLVRLLNFQLAKFRLGPDYARTFAGAMLDATKTHLRELYAEIIAPVRERLTARHLIIVPHDFLHHLPFQALLAGERYLIDDFSVSYAPSASVYYLCAAKEPRSAEGALVLGIADGLAPHILEEARAVASTLPNARLLLGSEATQDRLRAHAPLSRFVHIATHGLFRQDNPMFSSIRLADSRLSVFDLYHLDLRAELVTLSGCSTGRNALVGGDELLGLLRGLLYAGAQAVLVTLWDVNDGSTADFMRIFYQHLSAGATKAAALQQASREVRALYPHPYYWAPFSLIGKHSN
ncbi:MAG TPA: CHAT domain-containing tetratricopeptide repeat protein [Terriglobia bacterium]|nr:CHAT domain-containing tetratricopeptide repeat protein [Terriglobia bacterium]